METGFHTRKLPELKSFTGLYKIKGLLTLFKVTSHFSGSFESNFDSKITPCKINSVKRCSKSYRYSQYD